MKLISSIIPIYLIIIISISLTTTSCIIANKADGTSARKYYLSENGNDHNDGTTAASPWKTLNRLEAINFQPGDSILFEKNSEFFGGMKFKNSGSDGKSIVLSSYGNGEAPKFTNSDNSHLNGNVFQISGSHVTIDGLSFANCANSNSKKSREVLLIGAVYAVTGADYLIVRNSEFEDCPIGIYINSQHSLITNNYFHDCNRFLAAPGWGPIAVFIANAYNEISYNTCTNYIKVGGSFGADGGFLELDARFFGNLVHDIKIHHNKSFKNMGFMEVEKSANGDNLDVYYNLSADYQEFIFYWGGKNSKIENNTVIRTEPSVNGAVNTVFTMSNGSFTLRNNIFVVANGIQVLVTAPYGVGNYDDVVHENNLYYCTDGSVTNPLGKELTEGELIADPLFADLTNDDYKLSQESPAIDAGKVLGYTLDLYDNPVPAGDAPDAGAYEFIK